MARPLDRAVGCYEETHSGFGANLAGWADPARGSAELGRYPRIAVDTTRGQASAGWIRLYPANTACSRRHACRRLRTAVAYPPKGRFGRLLGSTIEA